MQPTPMIVRDAGGAEVAVILRRGLGMRYRILTDGQETAVRPRGFLGRRFEIDTPAGPMEARGNFSGHQYAIAQGGVPVAEVAQLRTLREQFAVHIADGQDAVLMLAVILVIETIRDNRRRGGRQRLTRATGSPDPDVRDDPAGRPDPRDRKTVGVEFFCYHQDRAPS